MVSTDGVEGYADAAGEHDEGAPRYRRVAPEGPPDGTGGPRSGPQRSDTDVSDGGPEESGADQRGASSGSQWPVRRTRRWRGVVAVVLVALAIGVLAARPALLLVAAVGVAFAAYPEVVAPPDPQLSIARRIHPESPTAGESVEVTTTVRNVGDAPLFDVRIVDGVPPMLSVQSGSPRRATALRPGEATTVTYSLTVDRATHRFRPTTVLVRDASGGTEVEATLVEETTIECDEPVLDVPLRARSRDRSGRLVTDRGGSGVEFHRTREYERGDPVNRIDWRTFARTGELTSIEFREERLAEVVVCVDARHRAYRASSPEDPHALAYGIGAADRIAEALFESGHRVGLAAFGAELCWLPPGAGVDHEERFSGLLGSDPAFETTPPSDLDPVDVDGVDGPGRSGSGEGGSGSGEGRSGFGESGSTSSEPGTGDSAVDRQLSTLRAQLGGGTQVVLLTPLCDAEASRIAQLLESAGCAVTVVSVDVTTDRTAGGRIARIERENRIHALRNTGVPVVDWDPEQRLGTALESATGWRP